MLYEVNVAGFKAMIIMFLPGTTDLNLTELSNY